MPDSYRAPGQAAGPREEFKRRTKRFALDVSALAESLPRSSSAQVIARQLLRSATSIGANYRAACRARSSAEFVAKMGIVEEEADEAQFWLELPGDSGIRTRRDLDPLAKEVNEFVAIAVASIRTARRTGR